jgi:uncharacterized protein
MTTAAYPAFEFVHPDFGRGLENAPARAEELGLRLAPNGRMSIVDGDASVRQALLLLLTTRPGERVMRPEYGCNLQTLAFSPNDDTTAGLAMHYVTQAIERWEPRVEIVRLNALRGAEREDVLEIVLDYRLVTRTRVERLVVPVSLAGRDS